MVLTVCAIRVFYPTVLNCCQGIVFTHVVRMGGRREKVCPGRISETLSCRKLILGGDIGLGGVGVQRHGLAVVTLTYKILSGLYLGNHKV